MAVGMGGEGGVLVAAGVVAGTLGTVVSGAPGAPGTEGEGELPGTPGTDGDGELPGTPGTDGDGDPAGGEIGAVGPEGGDTPWGLLVGYGGRKLVEVE